MINRSAKRWRSLCRTLVTNVRELENVIRSASLSVRGAVIDAPDLAVSVSDQPVEAQLSDLLGFDFHVAVSQFEKLLLKTALEKARGKRAEAARLERAPAVGSGRE
jgi:DNA-binding NtrC family response regulator